MGYFWNIMVWVKIIIYCYWILLVIELFSDWVWGDIGSVMVVCNFIDVFVGCYIVM